MEAYIRLALILVAAMLIGALLFNLLFRRNSIQIAKSLSERDDSPANSDESVLSGNREVSHLLPDQPWRSDHIKSGLARSTTNKDLTNDLLILYVVAKPGSFFASYDLLQTISAAGLQFGDMNIFHYYLPTETGDVKLFSLASATEPGEFDLNNIGDFSCVGLTLFMNIREVPNVRQAFNKMLKTAEQLADDLDGELRAGPHVPWSEKKLEEYQEKVLQF